MKDRTNLRRYERLQCAARGRAMWTDRTGQSRWAMVRILDLSESGVRLEVPQPVDTLSAISFSSDDMKMSGQAIVRFCRRQGTKYVVGAEFSGGGPVQLHSPA